VHAVWIFFHANRIAAEQYLAYKCVNPYDVERLEPGTTDTQNPLEDSDLRQAENSSQEWEKKRVSTTR
jgi:hypothetical protein